MRVFVSMALALSVILCFSTKSFAQDKWENLLVESAKVFEEMTTGEENTIPENLLEDCYAVAIFPSTISGGFFVGGKYGQGIIVAKEGKKQGKWTAPGIFNMGGASFGLQFGGQATDVILLIMSERGLDGIIQSKFKLGGDAAVAAGPVGRSAEASTDLQFKGGILSYSKSRGAFVGVKLEGAVISFNEEGNTALYEEGVTARDILINKTVKAPQASDRLMKVLKKY